MANDRKREFEGNPEENEHVRKKRRSEVQSGIILANNFFEEILKANCSNGQFKLPIPGVNLRDHLSDIYSFITKYKNEIHHLDLTGCHLNPDDTKYILSLLQPDKITHLNLSSNAINNESLKIISTFSNLQQLNLNACLIKEISDDIKNALKNLRHVVELNIGDNAIGSKGLCALIESFAHLYSLEAHHILSQTSPFFPPKLTDDALSAITKLTNLENLDLSGNNLSNTNLAKLSNSASIKHLILSGASLDNRSLDVFWRFQALKQLDISFNQITDLDYIIGILSDKMSINLRGNHQLNSALSVNLNNPETLFLALETQDFSNIPTITNEAKITIQLKHHHVPSLTQYALTAASLFSKEEFDQKLKEKNFELPKELTDKITFKKK